MANKDLRHAMSLAINRQNIVDTLFESGREPADNVFPPIIDKKGGSWEFAEYDPEKAKQIIDEKGLAGTTVKLSYNSGGGHEDIMSCIQADLQTVGLTVEQDTKEWLPTSRASPTAASSSAAWLDRRLPDARQLHLPQLLLHG